MLPRWFSSNASYAHLRQIQVWRGIAAGWRPIGSAVPLATAERRLAIWRRVRPEFTYRLSAV